MRTKMRETMMSPMAHTRHDLLADARATVRQKLTVAAEALARMGLPKPALDGKVLRPLAAYVLVPREHRDRLDERFWYVPVMAAPTAQPTTASSDMGASRIRTGPNRSNSPSLVL